MVRERAGLKDATTADVTTIMNERKCEFAFEGIRYWDLLRQGISIAANIIATQSSGVIVTSGGKKETESISASNITAKNGLMPIPNTQITLSNNVLKQNDGWK